MNALKRWLYRLAPAAMYIPLWGYAPKFDQEWHVYHFGAEFFKQPVAIFENLFGGWASAQVWGNFRPLGRFLEQSLDWVAFGVIQWFRLPLNSAIGLITMLGIALLSLSVHKLLDLLARMTGYGAVGLKLHWFVSIFLSATLVASGRQSPMLLFGGLYFISAALVLAAPAFVYWVWSSLSNLVLKWAILLSVGAAFAIFNELSYLAPFFVLALFATTGILTKADKSSWAALKESVAPVVPILIGFIPVFVSIRVILARACLENECYGGSSIKLGDAFSKTFIERLFSWNPVSQQWAVLSKSDGDVSLKKLAIALILLTVTILVTVVAVNRSSTPNLLAMVQNAPTRKKFAWSLVASGSVLLVFAAVLVSPSPALQEYSRLGLTWRESGLSLAGAALIAGGAFASISNSFGRNWKLLSYLFVSATIALAVVSFYVNSLAFANLENSSRSDVVTRIANEMIFEDPSRAGNLRRCRVLQSLRDIGPVKESYVSSLNEASAVLNKYEFCRER